MRLSVIIVNYNVKYFIEQALESAIRAAEHCPARIIVVDNASKDGSVAMIRERFPDVELIANKKNVGFSAANNQGIELTDSEFVLLLNPDTIVPEDSFERCIKFMDEHPDCGALGIRMLDGKGNFLPESKRGLPTPEVAFYKMTGLSSAFPKSQQFGRYHLGYLDEHKAHEVDVLAGAFMFMRREALDKAGLLDDTFFMYGEDIDLSYRIQKAGYKNYYFPDTPIIHFKGESTKKGSLNYVRIFYQAMIIFANKHFTSRQARFYTTFIRLAIYLRAFMAMIARVLGNLGMPLLDFAVVWIGMFGVQEFWAMNIKGAAEYYPPLYIYGIVPIYILIWLIGIFFSGGYDKPFRPMKLLRGIVAATLVIATVYAFLDESLRFSRALILLGAIWAGISLSAVRYFIHYLRYRTVNLDRTEGRRIAMVGNPETARAALSLLTQSRIDKEFVGIIAPETKDNGDQQLLGDTTQLKSLVDLFRIDELFFCTSDISTKEMIRLMESLGPGLNYRMVSNGAHSIIGSTSKNTAGEFYAVDANLSIGLSRNRRNKRVLDILLCFMFIDALILLLFFKNGKMVIRNILPVLFGKKSWVGYANTDQENPSLVLPTLKPGVFDPSLGMKAELKSEAIQQLNLLYAKDYIARRDLEIIWKNL